MDDDAALQDAHRAATLPIDPTSAPTEPSLNKEPQLNGISAEEATKQVHYAIRALLSDEFPDIAKKGPRRSSATGQYLQLTARTMKNYFKATWKTWWGVVYSFGKMLVGGVSPIDFLMSLVFSTCITIILTAGVIICIIAKIPFVGKAFDAYANSEHDGVSFINIVNSGMFKNFSEEELGLAKDAMSSTKPQQDHVMDIDVAKMMLLFTGLVYERSTEAKQEAIRQCSSLDWGHIIPEEVRLALRPNHEREFYRRHLRTRSSTMTSQSSRASTLSTVPPQRLAGDEESATQIVASPTRIEAAPEAPLQPNQSILTQGHPRYGTFPPAFADWQRQYISQSPYRIYTQPVRPTQQKPGSSTLPTVSTNATGSTGETEVAATKDGGVIYDAMQKWGFEYEPLSELDSASSAYCAAFWDKMSNWVVVAFKGTSPPEFDEWLVDFDYTRVPIGEYIPGYGTAHHGFKNRLFPDEPTLNRTPYETIMAGIKVITDDLLLRNGAEIANVYFTGHSLGSGIASLAYARAMMYIDGLDSRVRICDAYLFSSPIACDMPSAKLFNNSLLKGACPPRTPWRIVNHHDAVATLFPAFGDDPNYAYPDSLFAFAHMGTEVKMRRNGKPSIAANNYAPAGTVATAVTGIPPNRAGKVPEGMQVPKWMIFVQYIPLAGWMFSHFPGLYMESIQAMSPGTMTWKWKGAND